MTTTVRLTRAVVTLAVVLLSALVCSGAARAVFTQPRGVPRRLYSARAPADLATKISRAAVYEHNEHEFARVDAATLGARAALGRLGRVSVAADFSDDASFLSADDAGALLGELRAAVSTNATTRASSGWLARGCEPSLVHGRVETSTRDSARCDALVHAAAHGGPVELLFLVRAERPSSSSSSSSQQYLRQLVHVQPSSSSRFFFGRTLAAVFERRVSLAAEPWLVLRPSGYRERAIVTQLPTFAAAELAAMVRDFRQALDPAHYGVAAATSSTTMRLAANGHAAQLTVSSAYLLDQLRNFRIDPELPTPLALALLSLSFVTPTSSSGAHLAVGKTAESAALAWAMFRALCLLDGMGEPSQPRIQLLVKRSMPPFLEFPYQQPPHVEYFGPRRCSLNSLDDLDPAEEYLWVIDAHGNFVTGPKRQPNYKTNIIDDPVSGQPNVRTHTGVKHRDLLAPPVHARMMKLTDLTVDDLPVAARIAGEIYNEFGQFYIDNSSAYAYDREDREYRKLPHLEKAMLYLNATGLAGAQQLRLFDCIVGFGKHPKCKG